MSENLMISTEKGLSQLPASEFLSTWTQQSLETSRSFPGLMYSDPEIYQLEQRLVFGKSWVYVGHLAQLEGEGAFFTVEVAQQPLIVVRKSGQLKAFFNVCPHRGGPLASGCGQANSLTCQYHAWTFSLDGQLRAAPEMDSAVNFNRADHALTSVAVDTWGPFIFVNLDPNAAPLSVYLGDLPTRFQRYCFSDLVRAHTQDYWVDVNWKICTEITAESYHEPFVHQETWGKLYECTTTTAEVNGFYYFQHAPASVSLKELNSNEYIQTLNDQELQCAQMICLFPNLTVVMDPTYCITFLFDPQGGHRTRLRIDWLVPVGVASNPQKLQNLIRFFDDLMREDLQIMPRIQMGVESQGYRPGRLCPSREMGVHLFQSLVMKYLTTA
jgi:choline monooxygenase